MSFEFGESFLRELAEKIVIQRTSELKSAIYAINDVSKQYVVANDTSTNVTAVKSSIEAKSQPATSEPSPVVNVNVNFSTGEAIAPNSSNTAIDTESELERLRDQAAQLARPAGDQPIERKSDEIVGSGSVS